MRKARVALLLVSLVAVTACAGEDTYSFYAQRDAPTRDDVADAGIDTAYDAGQDPTADTGADLATDSGADLADTREVGADTAGDPALEPEIDAADADAGSDAGSDLTDVPVEPSRPFSFTVFGDNQFSTTSCTSGRPERLAIPQVVLDLAPTFILHTGDLMDHGYEDGAYAQLVDCYDDILSALPFFPTGGNHDFGSGGIERYKAYVEEQLFERNPLVYAGDYETDFLVYYEDDPVEWSTDRSDPSDRDLLPSGVTWKTYYAFRHENAAFISFEQGTRWWTQTPKPWLELHLSEAAADPLIDHIFVTMHHPMYSATMAESSDGECIEPVRRHYEDLFRQYDVTMVFSGHAHCYDHFYVPDDGHPTRESPPPATYPADGDGVHYIVTGGGGGGLTNGCDPFPLRQEHSYQYSQARGCFHHVTHVEVDGEAITVTIVSVVGGATDYVTAIEDVFALE